VSDTAVAPHNSDDCNACKLWAKRGQGTFNTIVEMNWTTLEQSALRLAASPMEDR
jgi:hypothetical protein